MSISKLEIENLNKRFFYMGENNRFGSGVAVSIVKKISIGNNNKIEDNSYLCINSALHNSGNEWNIRVHNDVSIGKNCIFEAFNRIEIYDCVNIGQNVYISDNYHCYSDYKVPIKFQGIKKVDNHVIIKYSATIGTGSVVLGNVSIGCNSIVLPNSVILKDVPDNCVVGGSPARLLRVLE